MATTRPIKYAELGVKIKMAREGAKLSHDRLGEIVGTSRQHLINLEKGWHLPGDELLSGIADATGQPLEFFGFPRARGEARSAELLGDPFRGGRGHDDRGSVTGARDAPEDGGVNGGPVA